MLCNQKFKPDARSNYTLSVACPLWVKSRQMRAKRYVRFTPKSRHVRRNYRCPQKGPKADIMLPIKFLPIRRRALCRPPSAD